MIIINEEVKRDIEKAKERAKKKVFTADMMQKLASGDLPPPGDSPHFRCDIPIGVKVVYTLEEHPLGLCEHISISSAGLGSVPPAEEIHQILEAYGIDLGFTLEPKPNPGNFCKIKYEESERCVVYQEDMGGGEIAVNFIIKVKEDDKED
ncbi:MAG: hypothetical protein ACXADB_04850 [Candidatus Hermodarchaeia archaeon]|jgi:hypothetical protein